MKTDELDTGDWVVSTLLELSLNEEGDMREDIDFDELLESAVEDWAGPMYDTIRNDQRRLDYWRGTKNGFEQRLYIEWQDAIDLLETFVVVSFEEGNKINHEHREQAAENQDYVFEALTYLHARACQVSQEILVLTLLPRFIPILKTPGACRSPQFQLFACQSRDFPLTAGSPPPERGGELPLRMGQG